MPPPPYPKEEIRKLTVDIDMLRKCYIALSRNQSKQSWLKKCRIYIKILMMYLSSVAYIFSHYVTGSSPSHCSYVVKSIQVTIHLLLSQVTNQEKCDYKNIYNKMVTCISILVIDIYMLELKNLS